MAWLGAHLMGGGSCLEGLVAGWARLPFSADLDMEGQSGVLRLWRMQASLSGLGLTVSEGLLWFLLGCTCQDLWSCAAGYRSCAFTAHAVVSSVALRLLFRHWCGP